MTRRAPAAYHLAGERRGGGGVGECAELRSAHQATAHPHQDARPWLSPAARHPSATLRDIHHRPRARPPVCATHAALVCAGSRGEAGPAPKSVPMAEPTPRLRTILEVVLHVSRRILVDFVADRWMGRHRQTARGIAQTSNAPPGTFRQRLPPPQTEHLCPQCHLNPKPPHIHPSTARNRPAPMPRPAQPPHWPTYARPPLCCKLSRRQDPLPPQPQAPPPPSPPPSAPRTAPVAQPLRRPAPLQRSWPSWGGASSARPWASVFPWPWTDPTPSWT